MRSWESARARVIARALLAGALGLAGAVMPAVAQPTPATSSALRDYDIPAGALSTVLARFASEAGVLLSVDARLTEGRQTDGLRGRHGVADGFARILESTGLEAVRDGQGYALRTSPPPSGATTTLPAVTVTATADEETAWSPVGGVVARRSASGSKTDTALIETPQTINIVTREEMTARGADRTVLEALAYTPGFLNTQSVNTRADYGSLRGFDAYQSMYVDGLNVPYGLDRAAPQTEPYGLERIEVLKGPASVLYGQAAPGGLINAVSKRPTAERRSEVDLHWGTYSRLEAGVDFSGPITQDRSLLYRLVGFGRDSDTQIDFVKDDRKYVAPSLTWLPGADTSLTLLASYQDDEGGEFGNAFPIEVMQPPGPFGRVPLHRNSGEPDDRYDREQKTFGWAFEHRFTEVWSLAQNARWQDLEVGYDNPVFPALRPDGRTVDRSIYLFDEQLETLAVDTRMVAQFATGAAQHTVMIGVDYRHQQGDSANGYHYNAAAPFDLFDPVYGQSPDDLGFTSFADTDFKQWGWYAQDQVRIGRWALTLGGRHDSAKTDFRSTGAYVYDNSTKDSAFTGRAGLVYLFDNGFAPYASYTESFQPVTGSSPDFFGRPFDPVTARQLETGLKYQPSGQTAFVTLAAFDLAQQNVLTTDTEHECVEENVPVGCGFFSKQVGEIRVRGVELEGKAELGRFDLTAAYAFMKSEFTRSNDGNEGLEKSNVPRHQASAWVDYRFEGAATGLNFGAGVRRTGAYYGDDFEQVRNDSVTLVDASARCELGEFLPLARGVNLGVNVRNLADEDYLTCSFGNCSYGLRRTVEGTLSYRW